MNRGGAESMVMNYYRHIDKSKIQFDFMVHRKERGDYDDEIEALGGKIYRMRNLNPLTFREYQNEISEFFDIHSEYKIIHGHCSESGYFVYKEASRRGVPVIIAHAHNSYALFDLKWIFRIYFKYKMRNYITNQFTCGRQSAEWLFGNKNADNAILQHNAIDTSLFRYEDKDYFEMRRKLNLPIDAMIVGHVGRFEKQKNHLFILKIFASIHKMESNTFLLLIGTGKLMNSIKKEAKRLGIEDSIIFLGNRTDVHSLLNTMNLFLFPSFMEGLSLSMVEAQCSGLPCLVSDAIPIEVKMTNLVSFLSLKEPSNKWAEIAIDLMKKINFRENYYKEIENHGYDIARNAIELQNIYINLLSGK